MSFDFRIIEIYWKGFIMGSVVAVEVSFISLFIGCIIGLLAGLGKISNKRFISSICKTYISLIRSTPLLVQLYFVYFGLPQIGIKISAIGTGIIGLSLNSGAYIAEIVRAGIQSISKGQMEAAYSIGLTYPQVMKEIILPQCIPIILPPLVGQLAILVKDSSLLLIIGIDEITRAANRLASRTFCNLEAYSFAAILYLIICLFLFTISDIIRRKLILKT